MQQEKVLHGQWNDHGGKFRSLAFVDADGVGGFDFVQFAEFVDHAASVEFDPRLPLLRVDGRNAPDIAVEDFLFVVVARLQDFVAHAKFRPEALDLRTIGPRRIERGLQGDVQFAYAEASAVHRREHLHVAHRIQSHALGNFLTHQPQNEPGNFLRFLPVHEGEVGSLPARVLRNASVPHIVRGPHDAAGFCLAENLGQARRRHRTAGQQIGQHRARTHAGELVGIADEEERTARRKRAAERGHKRNIDHGKFINHHEVGIERLLRSAFETTGGKKLQKTVNGLGAVTGRLAHPFGRTPGRRAQLEADFFCAENFQQAVKKRGFAHPGSAGDDRNTGTDHSTQSLHLAGGEGFSGFLLHPLESFFEIKVR